MQRAVVAAERRANRAGHSESGQREKDLDRRAAPGVYTYEEYRRYQSISNRPVTDRIKAGLLGERKP